MAKKKNATTETPIDIRTLQPRLTSDETAKLCRITKRGLWKRHREGRGPQPIKSGARLLWDRDEVLRYLGLATEAEA